MLALGIIGLWLGPVYAQTATTPVVSFSQACNATFSKNMHVGSKGQNVMNLQKFLNISPETQISQIGDGSPGHETATYGPATATAVKKFQEKYRSLVLLPAGLKAANGVFGSLTRTQASLICVQMNEARGKVSNYNKHSSAMSGGKVAAATTGFTVGDTVQVGAALRVRQSPGLTAPVVGHINTGSKGIIVGGPQTADAMVWLKVKYSDTFVGWSTEAYLVDIGVTSQNTSTDGAFVTSSTGSLTDSFGNIWAITATADKKITKNGNSAELPDSTYGVVFLLWYNGAIYQQAKNPDGSLRGWWRWSGETWIPISGDPRPVGQQPGTLEGGNPGGGTTSGGTSGGTASVTLTVAPSSIGIDGSAIVTWVSTNTTSCTGFNFSPTGVSGVMIVNPQNTTTYQVTCGSASAQATLTIAGTQPGQQPPTGGTPTGNTGGAPAGNTGGSNSPAPNPSNGTSPLGTSATPGSGGIVDNVHDVWTISSGGAVLKNGQTVDTASDATIIVWYNHMVYKRDTSNNWTIWLGFVWYPVDADPRPGAVVGASGATGNTVGGTVIPPTGQFVVKNGKIYDPQGKEFSARGLNVGDTSIAQPVMNLFPGINFIRFAIGEYQPASYFQNFVDQLTAQKIVVEIEHHPWPLERSASGQALNDEANWYASLASAFKNNPYVWFGTMNEPQNDYGADEANITAEQLATYNAIRGAGAGNIMMMEAGTGGGNPGAVGAGSGLTESSYTSMKNVVWDLHFYGWTNNYNPDQNSMNSVWLGSAGSHSGTAGAQTITSADGIIPVINGEFGPSTTGGGMDANANQVIQAVTVFGPANGGSGYAGWHWNADPNNAVQNGGNLTSWGQQLSAAIRAASGR